MKRYLVELLGTFFLVLVIGLSGNPITIGVVLMVLVYLGYHTSGAQYNPGVTLAVTILSKMKWKEAGIYMVFQLIGAMLAGAVCTEVNGTVFTLAPDPFLLSIRHFLIEVIFTFFMVMLIFFVAVSKKTRGNIYYGFAIGAIVCVIAYFGGPISGGAYNPAVGIGPILTDVIFNGGPAEDVWLYLCGPMLGAVIAALVYRRMR